MTPQFENKPAMTFIGLGKDFDMTEQSAIGALWDLFLEQKHFIDNPCNDAAYGLCYAPQEKETFSDRFHYTAALQVPADTKIPEGMEKIELPAHKYAVFTHKGPLHKLQETNDYIWKTWLPKSGYELADAPDIEIYGEQWNAEQENGAISICLPIL